MHIYEHTCSVSFLTETDELKGGDVFLVIRSCVHHWSQTRTAQEIFGRALVVFAHIIQDSYKKQQHKNTITIFIVLDVAGSSYTRSFANPSHCPFRCDVMQESIPRSMDRRVKRWSLFEPTFNNTSAHCVQRHRRHWSLRGRSKWLCGWSYDKVQCSKPFCIQLCATLKWEQRDSTTLASLHSFQDSAS